MKNLLLFFMACMTYMANAQSSVINPRIEWSKVLGGKESDEVYSVKQTPDGGYIEAGISNSNLCVVKLSKLGYVNWSKIMGGHNIDMAQCVALTADGGYIVAGSTKSRNGDVQMNHGKYDCWVIKLNKQGNVSWQKTYGGRKDDAAYSIQQTMDGGYIVAGSSESNDGDVHSNHGDKDYWIFKLDTQGNILWEKNLGGTQDEIAYCIQQTNDQGYIVAGFTSSGDIDVQGHIAGYDYWIVKLDMNGNMEWQKCLGGTSSEQAHGVQQTTDNGYIIAGWTASSNFDVTGLHGLEDCWLVKLDRLGNLSWQKCLGGSRQDYAKSIRNTADGGYIMSGMTFSNDGDVHDAHAGYPNYSDAWIVKLDPNGIIQDATCYGGTSSDFAYEIQQTKDGGFVFAGSSFSDDGDVGVNHGIFDGWVVKLKPATLLSAPAKQPSAGPVLMQKTKTNIQVLPNPSVNGVFTIQFKTQMQDIYVSVLDNAGVPVWTASYHTVKQFSVQLSSRSKGIYYLKIKSKDGEETLPLIYQ